MADIEKVRRNIRRMIDGGASGQEIDTYLGSEGVTLDQVRGGKPTALGAKPGQSTAAMIARNVAQGGFFNMFPQVAGARYGVPGSQGLMESIARGTLQGPEKRQEYLANINRIAGTEQKRIEETPSAVAIPAQIAGSLLWGPAGGAALKGASTAGGIAARSAGLGAGEAALYGFGGAKGGIPERLTGAATAAPLGAALGGAIGGIQGKLAQRAANKAIPSTEKVRKISKKAFEKAERAGVVVSGDSFSDFGTKLLGKVQARGYDEGLHPNTSRAIARLTQEMEAGELTLKKAHVLRRVFQSATKPRQGPSPEDDARLAHYMLDKLDDYIGGLKASDTTAGGEAVEGAARSLKKGIKQWGRYRRAEEIEDLVERAGDRAGQYTGSGFENALRTEFRALVMNKKRLRRFTPEEQKAIRRVARGGFIGNKLRQLGKLAPTGVISAGIGAYGGSAIAGAPGAIGLPALGAASRMGATAATHGAARRVSDIVRAGGRLPKADLSPKARDSLGAAIAASGKTAGDIPEWLREILGY